MNHCLVIIFAILTLSISCKSVQSNEKAKAEFQSVLEIPDSLLTIEQDFLKRELVDILINYIDYKDDKVVFLMTKDEFLKTGFAPEYYDIFINGFDENNRILKSFPNDIDWSKVINDKKEEHKKSLVKQKESEYDTNLYEYGGVTECEDNLKNLFHNFPIYVENGDEIDLLSYDFVGIIKNEKDVRKYVKKNFDDSPLLGWSNKMSVNGDDYSSSIRLVINRSGFAYNNSTIKEMVKTISDKYVNVGDKVYAIDYLLELQNRRHYIFVNPQTKKVVLGGNLFGVDMTMSHVEYINEKRSGH